MVATDGREKRAPLDNLASVLSNALFLHAYKPCYAEPGVSARRLASPKLRLQRLEHY